MQILMKNLFWECCFRDLTVWPQFFINNAEIKKRLSFLYYIVRPKFSKNAIFPLNLYKQKYSAYNTS
jgi:hypothetical protein